MDKNVENESEMVFCQSCGMPLSEDEDFGNNADGSKNDEYCAYCYKEGKFAQDVTMNDMIEFCIPFVVEANQGMTDEQARQCMSEWFPTLKRWQTA